MIVGIRPPSALGRRGAVLLYLALVDALYALSLWRPAPAAQRTPATRFLAEVAPLTGWAALWLVVGVLCFTGALRHRARPVAYAAAVAIKALWGLVFLLGWLAGEIDRGWVSAVVWLGLAALVAVLAGWPEPVADTRVDL